MDVIDLTRRLVSFDTVNPPGNEEAAIRFCAGLLEQAGFDCDVTPMGKRRANLIATRGLTPGGHALGFSGHLDTVPLGSAAWRHPPLGGELADGRIHGRGSADMKGGVAAFLAAAINTPPPPGGVSILLTAGEETGDEGARALVAGDALPPVGALIVGEPTLNQAVPGHKGALWLRLRTSGVSAHGSMPERGVNAVSRMVAGLSKLEDFRVGTCHPVMGPVTLSIGTIHGGLNTNSVPDACEVTLDLRSTPEFGHAALIAEVATRLGPLVNVEPILDLPSVWTPPDQPWIAALTSIAQGITGEISALRAMSYFTDAALLTSALGGVPTLLLGPGDPERAHQTDEWVAVERLQEAEAIYSAAIGAWTGLATPKH